MAAFAQLAAVSHESNTCVYFIAIFKMCESTEQRICIKFRFKIGKLAKETYQLLQQTYGEDALRRTQVFKWFTVEGSILSATKGAPGAKQNKGHVSGFFFIEGIVHHEYDPDGPTVKPILHGSLATFA